MFLFVLDLRGMAFWKGTQLHWGDAHGGGITRLHFVRS